MQAQFESGKASPSQTLPDRLTLDFQENPSSERIEALFDASAECSRCYLKVHQTDARFCRNCAALLSQKRFD